jgi:chromosome partitioning protein
MAIDKSMMEFLHKLKNKFSTILTRGEKVIENLATLLQRSVTDKVALEDIQSEITNNRTLKRRYGTTQAAEMVKVSHSLIYAAEQDGRLPEPIMRTDTKKATRAGYTLNDINRMRQYFGTNPTKPPKSLAAVVGILNLKGGCQKTTHCQLFSQYLAIQGYKVLVIDTDPQGSLSLMFGKRPDADVSFENTIGPYLLEADEYLQEHGFEPGASENLEYAVQSTYWSNIDIIPACLANLNIDTQMTEIMDDASLSWTYKVTRLRDGLASLRDNYDFILIDGTPSLNFSTLNVISACDMVYVPTPAAYADFSSTIAFTGLIETLVNGYIEQGEYPNIPDVRYFIAKFSKSSSSQFWSTIIRKVFNLEKGDVLDNESYHTDEIGKASTNGSSIYEVSPSEADNRQRLKKDTEMFDNLFGEMHDKIWEFHWGELPRKNFVDKVDDIKLQSDKIQKELDDMIGETA